VTGGTSGGSNGAGRRSAKIGRQYSLPPGGESTSKLPRNNTFGEKPRSSDPLGERWKFAKSERDSPTHKSSAFRGVFVTVVFTDLMLDPLRLDLLQTRRGSFTPPTAQSTLAGLSHRFGSKQWHESLALPIPRRCFCSSALPVMTALAESSDRRNAAVVGKRIGWS